MLFILTIAVLGTNDRPVADLYIEVSVLGFDTCSIIHYSLMNGLGNMMMGTYARVWLRLGNPKTWPIWGQSQRGNGVSLTHGEFDGGRASDT